MSTNSSRFAFAFGLMGLLFLPSQVLAHEYPPPTGSSGAGSGGGTLVRKYHESVQSIAQAALDTQ